MFTRNSLFLEHKSRTFSGRRLILKGSKLVIPQTLRGEILSQIHVGHMGIEKCRQREQEVVCWPGINQEIETMV